MPSKYTVDTLPKPKDKDIQIVEVPSEVLGVIFVEVGPAACSCI